jgi:prepilin-type N-terminal cleavage/methylation domain-containing protein
MKRFSRSGFTLVEISLVLVIIGLIVGGIVVGQSVMRSSQVQSVITDVNTYSNAIRQFQQKYNYLPGDMPTATTFWGVNSSVTHNDLLNCAWQGVTIASTTSTCDGNGDGSIDGTNASTSWTNEAIMAWKHMQNAGFLGAGKLTGLDYQCNGCIQVGTDVPASRVQGAGFTINNTKNLWAPLGGAYVYPWGTASYQHVLQFGTSTDTTGATLGPALTTD